MKAPFFESPQDGFQAVEKLVQANSAVRDMYNILHSIHKFGFSEETHLKMMDEVLRRHKITPYCISGVDGCINPVEEIGFECEECFNKIEYSKS